MATSGDLLSDPMVGDMKDAAGNKIAVTDFEAFSQLKDAELEKLAKAISDETVEEVIKKVEALTDKDYSAVEFSIFDYIGFDPLMIARVMKAYQTHYKESDELLLSDIKFSIAACLYMGNLQAKAINRRGMEGRVKLEYLARKYGIRMGSQGTGIPSTALTFPRVAASFPVLAIRMAQKIPPKAVNLEFRSILAPPYMRLTPFGSLCSAHMDSELRLLLLEACNAHGSDMAIAYEKGRQKKKNKGKEIKYDPVAIAHDQWAFMEIAAGSPVPSESVKKGLLTSLNLGKDYANIADLVKNYRAILQKQELDKVSVLSKEEFDNRLSTYVTS